MCIRVPVLLTGTERLKGGDILEGKSMKKPADVHTGSADLSDTLGHVQGGQHLFKYGSFHVGPSQVGFLKVAAGQVTVL